jgi:hypothetical protein
VDMYGGNNLGRDKPQENYFCCIETLAHNKSDRFRVQGSKVIAYFTWVHGSGFRVQGSGFTTFEPLNFERLQNL